MIDKIKYILPAMIAIIDILVKKLVKSSFVYGESKKLIGDFIRLTYIENSGIAFGLFGGIPNTLLKNILFTIVTLAAIVFIIYLIRKNEEKVILISLYFILGGAFGNVLERVFGHIFYDGEFKIFYGRVVDFVDIGIKSSRWPSFNIADSFITIGVIILIIYTLFFENKKKRNQENVNAE